MVDPIPNDETLLAEAMKLATPEEREAFLKAACGIDDSLQARVEQFLAARGQAGKSGEQTEITPSLPTELTRLRVEQPGDIIGRFKLLQVIGEGGFGIVYLAEQREPVKRRVALKILKPGMDTREVVARFEAERQALAQMDHPNIARVFDGGATESGRPYFVMELVKGVPLTKYCDDNQLPTRQRLDLFLDVLAAVQHAHQKGIIHRDIKPSNILVSPHDGVPVVKVIDFGIAKAISMELTERTLFTGLGQMIGTPLYMSPEQAEINALDVDTRSDIYSLGVVLYELLTGHTPLDAKALRAAGYAEIQRLIREAEPPKPSTRLSTLGEALPEVARQRSAEPVKLGKLIRGDLDWIVMKALEKDRNRRYETANGFAADIRRYFAHEPVEAGRPSRIYRMRKMARRHKGPLTAAAAVFLTLVAGVAVSTWQAIAARAARDESDQQAIAAGIAREQARQDAAISREANDFILFGAANPDREPDRDLKVRMVLDRASERIGRRFEDQPLVEASIRLSLANTYIEMGEHEIGRKHAARSMELRRRVLGPEHPDTLWAMASLAASYVDAGRMDEALKMREAVLMLRRKVSGPEHPDTVWAMASLAASYFDAGRRDEALKLREEVLTLRRKVLGPEDPDTLTAMRSLAFSYFNTGHRNEALKIQEDVLPLCRKVLGPEDPDTLTSMHNLAAFCREAGRQDEALKMYEEVLALRRKVSGPAHPDTLNVMNNLAISYDEAAQKAEEPATRKMKHTDSLAGAAPVVAVIIAPTAPWKWLHPAEGKDPAETTSGFHHSFFQLGFDDASWQTGADSEGSSGGFAYGEDPFDGVNIGKPAGDGHLDTAWFRHRFTTEREHANVELRCQRDDGIIVYLDGKEAIRDNMADGSDSPSLPAIKSITTTDEAIVHRFPIPGTIAAGDHTLAISLHNPAEKSTDLRIAGITLVEINSEAAVAVEPNAAAPPAGTPADPADGTNPRPGAALREKAKALRKEVQELLGGKALPSHEQMRPSHLAALEQRAERRARHGEWKEAAADIARAVELDPANRGQWCSLAPLLVQSGELEGYRKHRHAMLEKFRSATDIQAMEQIAKNALLLPAEGPDLADAGKLADSAAALGKDHPYRAYFRFALGLAQFRRGEFAEAIATESAIVPDSGVPERDMQAYAVIAMSHHHLNQPGEARAALDKAADLSTSKLPAINANEHANWGDLLIAHVLLHEARTMLGEK